MVQANQHGREAPRQHAVQLHAQEDGQQPQTPPAREGAAQAHPAQSSGDLGTEEEAVQDAPPEELEGTPTLPPELWAEVLRHVELVQRHASCALVCSGWYDAVSQTPGSIRLESCSQARADILLGWLGSKGRHVLGLSVQGGQSCSEAGPAVRALPHCGQLQALDLQHCHLQLAPLAWGLPGVLHGLTSLTSLSIGCPGAAGRHCAASTYVNARRGFSALSSLTALRHLQCAWGVDPCGPAHDEEAEPSREFPPGVLSHLVQLTHLELCSFDLRGPALKGLSALLALQHLQLGVKSLQGEGARVSEGALAAVSGLQRLATLIIFSADTLRPPSLSDLPALQVLQVKYSAGLEPAVLDGLCQLQHLEVQHTPVAGESEGAGQLLAVLPQLSQLTCLCLFHALKHSAPAAGLEDYTALVASSSLQRLQLSGCALPYGAWRTMFGQKGKHLPHLTTLVVNDCAAPRLQTTDLANITQRGAPHLRQMNVSGTIYPGADLSVLSELRDLGGLCVSDVHQWAAGCLARLTNLTALVIYEPNGITPDSLGPLTALRLLQDLRIQAGRRLVDCAGDNDWQAWKGPDCELQSDAQQCLEHTDGGDGDAGGVDASIEDGIEARLPVWQQLLALGLHQDDELDEFDHDSYGRHTPRADEFDDHSYGRNTPCMDEYEAGS